MEKIIKFERVNLMLKSKKLPLLLALIFVFTVFFTQTAMASDINPFSSMNSINSMESHTNLQIIVNATNQSAAEKQELQSILLILQNLNLTIDTKLSKNADNTNTNAYAKLGMTFMTSPINFEMWVKANVTNGQPNFSETIKLPTDSLLVQQVLQQMKIPTNKSYFVISSADLAGLSPNASIPNIDMTKATEFSKKFNDIFSAFFTDAKNKFNLVTDKGDEAVTTPGGIVNAHGFEVKLDDTGFKTLLKYTIDTMAQNKDFIATLKDYMSSLGTGTSSADIDKQLASAIDNFDKSFDSLKDVKIVGDKGIVLDFDVDQNGYIVYEKGAIDLVFDTAKLSPILDKIMSTENISSTTVAPSAATGVYDIFIGFDTTNFNINNDVKIDDPQVTSDNSMSLVDLIKTLTPSTTTPAPNTEVKSTDNKTTTPASKPTTTTTKKPVVKKPAVKKPVVKKPTIKKSKPAPKKVVKKGKK